MLQRFIDVNMQCTELALANLSKAKMASIKLKSSLNLNICARKDYKTNKYRDRLADKPKNGKKVSTITTILLYKNSTCGVKR